jgi:hypothetical protein
MFELSELFNLKKTSKWFVLLIIVIIIYILYSNVKSSVKEDFAFVPWNMGTRFYPSYDLRGYPRESPGSMYSHPLIYPWNYPYPGYPFLYWSPYFYEASGKYKYNPKYAKLLNQPYIAKKTS